MQNRVELSRYLMQPPQR